MLLIKRIAFLSCALILTTSLALAQGNDNDECNGNADGNGNDECDAVTAAAPPPGGGGGGGSTEPIQLHETYARQNIREDLSPYGVDLIGEQFDLGTGTLSFTHTDVVLPGNNGLEVAIRRTVNTAQHRFLPVNEFGDWELDVPKMEMLVSTVTMWKSDRCTQHSDPGVVTKMGTVFNSEEYWNGLKMHIPGQGAQTVLDSPQDPQPTEPANPETYKTTNQYWAISCTNIGSSERFIATSPAGIKYHFNYLRYQPASGIYKNFKVLSRSRAQMMATRVEDRFGNYVDYNYSGGNLMSIVASDGRTITITYVSGTDRISTVTANGRIWNYGYETHTGYSHHFLSSVTLPDTEAWDIDIWQLIIKEPFEGLKLICGDPPTTASGSITHPHGPKGTYTVTETPHGRTDVPKRIIINPGNESCSGEGYYYQRSFDVMSLTHKKLEGKGMPTYIWDYSYSGQQGGWVGDGSNPIKTTRVDKPDGTYDIHHFNRSWASYLEGSLTKHEVFAADSTLLQTIDYTYEQGPSRGIVGELFHENMRPMIYHKGSKKTTTKRGADEYYTENTYDNVKTSPNFSFGNPIQIAQWNNLVAGHASTDDIGYLHDHTHWELGRQTTVNFDKGGANEELVSENHYDTNNRVQYVDRYGVQVREFSYNLDGTVAWQEDALNNRTTMANWKRGIPQTITYPDLTTHIFVVENNGWITDSTDAKDYTTAYTWNSVGRLTNVAYPTNDGIARLAKTLDLIEVTTTDDGLAGSGVAIGQWKHVKTRGDLKITSYLDALFRPVLTRTQDTNIGSSLDRFTRQSFDHNNQPTFTSFPSATVAAASGTDTSFDALRRVLESEENVTPFADTTYAYQNGNKIFVTNPRGKPTTTTYFALGSPDQSLPISIVQPESVMTTITRNDFGEMTQVSQSGVNPTVSATRSYYYDSRHNLCRQVEPETGSTAYSTNNAGQLEWYALAASGSTTACDLASVPAGERILHSYNSLGQVTDVNYPDGSPDLTYGYDNNGNLTSLVNTDASWTYTHNAVNTLDSELLATGSQTFALSYSFDTMDRLDSITYPGSTVVPITPNAYGAPESVGSYATGIDYHANGSISVLNYGTQQGTGRKYTTTQDARQLPENLKVEIGASTTLADLTHFYDANANILSITDAVNGASFDRAIGYDDLDRLTSASGFWGTGSYSFDALGNMLTKTEADIGLSYSYNSTFNRLSSITDSIGSVNYSFAYDAYGNVTGNGNQGFTYNLAGHLTNSTSPAVSYLYDGQKRRVQKTEGGQTSYTVYGQNGKLMHKLKGGVSTHYVYAGSLLIAELQGSTVNYLHTDLLGSPIKGDNGTAYSEHYRPWGEKKDHPVQLADDVGYTGHQSDVATGLTYMQARYYDPVMGRFMAADPVGFTTSNPMSFNRYLYVNNNPYKYNDPNGEFLNFAIKFVADVAVNVAFNYVTTGEANIGGALTESALGVLNPAKTVKKIAKLGEAIKDARKAKAVAKTCCFVAGTLVDTEDGLRPIESIEVGDNVWARDIETGETALKVVTDLIRRHEREIWIVELTSSDGTTSRFETTDDHPWWIPVRGWVRTDALNEGIVATARDGDTVHVTSVYRTDRTDSTFNLTVDDFETYFVGEQQVLVHNCKITEGGRRTKHIDNNHVDRNKNPDKSKFKKPNQIEKINQRTVRNPDRKVEQGTRTRYEKDFGRDIGTKGERTNVTVIDNRTNKRVTQFPTE